MTLLADAVALETVRRGMRILSASGVDATLLMCRGWPDLIGFASEAPGLCVAIVDPYDGDMLVSEELIGDACRLARGCGCIIYATFDGRPAGDVAKLVRLGIRDVVTRHVDDSPHRIAAAIRESLGMVKLEEMVAAPVSALTVHQQTIVDRGDALELVVQALRAIALDASA